MDGVVRGPKTVVTWSVLTGHKDHPGQWYGRCPKRFCFGQTLLSLLMDK